MPTVTIIANGHFDMRRLTDPFKNDVIHHIKPTKKAMNHRPKHRLVLVKRNRNGQSCSKGDAIGDKLYKHAVSLYRITLNRRMYSIKNGISKQF